MKGNDILFKDLTNDKKHKHKDFCFYGWEGIGSFAFWKYAQAYFESAEVLFDKIKESSGKNSTLDNLGITMCFLYRHFVELAIKYLYVKYVCQSEEEYKKFLGKGHNLSDLWHIIKPKLGVLKKRVGSSVNLGILEHYIMEFNRFDKDSMAMRYPVKKDLTPMNKETRLDIFNLHDKMNELYWALEGIDNDLDYQLFVDISQDKIDSFLSKYVELKEYTLKFIETMEQYESKEAVEPKNIVLPNKVVPSKNRKDIMKVYNSYNDDELILFDTLYYTGQEISLRHLKLPKNPHEAKIDAIKMCIMNMQRDHLEFGKPKNDEINIYSKNASFIVKYIRKAMFVIDWNQ